MAGISPKLPLSIDFVDGISLNKTLRETLSQNLKNVMLTIPGERIMDTNFGVGFHRFMFEPMVPGLSGKIRDRIRDQISQYMPFVQINSIDVKRSRSGDNIMSVVISYAVPSIGVGDVLDVNATSYEF